MDENKIGDHKEYIYWHFVQKQQHSLGRMLQQKAMASIIFHCINTEDSSIAFGDMHVQISNYVIDSAVALG